MRPPGSAQGAPRREDRKNEAGGGGRGAPGKSAPPAGAPGREKSCARSTGGPGGHLRFAPQPFPRGSLPTPTPTPERTWADDSSGVGGDHGLGCKAAGEAAGREPPCGLALDPRLRPGGLRVHLSLWRPRVWGSPSLGRSEGGSDSGGRGGARVPLRKTEKEFARS